MTSGLMTSPSPTTWSPAVYPGELEATAVSHDLFVFYKRITRKWPFTDILNCWAGGGKKGVVYEDLARRSGLWRGCSLSLTPPLSQLSA